MEPPLANQIRVSSLFCSFFIYTVYGFVASTKTIELNIKIDTGNTYEEIANRLACLAGPNEDGSSLKGILSLHFKTFIFAATSMVVLKGIPSVLSPEVLYALAKMGHGDELGMIFY